MAAWWLCSYLDKRCWNFSSQWRLPRHCPAPQRGRSLLREHTKPFSSSIQAACLSVWIQSKSRRCFGYFLPELEGIIEGYYCHSKELCSWPHFLLLPSNVNRWNLTAWITRRVHFSTRNSLFLLPFSLSTLSPLLGTIFFHHWGVHGQLVAQTKYIFLSSHSFLNSPRCRGKWGETLSLRVNCLLTVAVTQRLG